MAGAADMHTGTAYVQAHVNVCRLRQHDSPQACHRG